MVDEVTYYYFFMLHLPHYYLFHRLVVQCLLFRNTKDNIAKTQMSDIHRLLQLAHSRT